MRGVPGWITAALERRSALSGAPVAVVGLAVGTVALVPLRDRVPVSSVSLLFLIPVVVTAVFGDLWSTLLVVVGAALLVNFFFVPPYHTFVVQSGADVVLLVVYALVAAVTGLAVRLALRYRTTATRLAEVDRLRATLLAAVGHELRTPLAGMKAAVSTLRQADVAIPGAARRVLLADAEGCTDRLTALVENLLSVSRLRAGGLSVRLTPVALDGVAAAALVSAGTGAVLDVPDDLPLVRADGGLLEQVIVNLVRNAAQADPDGTIRLVGRVRADRAELAVVDHGPGVPEADWAAMFDPFERLTDRPDRPGLGLGLTVVRGFTEAMGGVVRPSRTVGGGLTVTVSLPLAGDAR